MGKLKGQMEYEKFLKGDKLSRGQAIKANCYVCNGLEDSGEDCLGKSCTLYPFQPYKGKKKSKQDKSALLNTSEQGVLND